MAYRKKNPKVMRKRRRPVVKRKRVARRLLAPPTTMMQIPKVYKLRYAETFTLNTGLGTWAMYSFSANSCHKPNYSATGHQPMKWDQFSSYFNSYVVLGSRIRVQHLGGSAATGTSLACGIHLNDDTTVSTTNLTAMIEQGQTQWKAINEAADIRTSVYKNFSAKKFFNIKDVKDNLSTVGAAVGANPSNEAFFNFWIGALDGTTTSLGGNFLAVVDYIVSFSEPKDFPQS